MITFYLEAESLADLRHKAMAALGITDPLSFAVPADGTVTAPPPEPFTAPPAAVPVPEAPDKPRRKHRATRPLVPTQKDMDEIARESWAEAEAQAAAILEPEPLEPLPKPKPLEPLEDVDLGSFEYTDDEVRSLTVFSSPPGDALAHEKVKAEVIDKLADLFTAGKVKLLRSLLDTYGNGAKTFAEIDANKFPVIREAMQRGEAA